MRAGGGILSAAGRGRKVERRLFSSAGEGRGRGLLLLHQCNQPAQGVGMGWRDGDGGARPGNFRWLTLDYRGYGESEASAKRICLRRRRESFGMKNGRGGCGSWAYSYLVSGSRVWDAPHRRARERGSCGVKSGNHFGDNGGIRVGEKFFLVLLLSEETRDREGRGSLSASGRKMAGAAFRRLTDDGGRG